MGIKCNICFNQLQMWFWPSAHKEKDAKIYKYIFCEYIYVCRKDKIIYLRRMT